MKKLTIDFQSSQAIIVDGNGESQSHDLSTSEAFDAVSRAWLRSGWDAKYVYSFTWLGRPIIQNPEDMIRLQELIFAVKPDVIVETGIAHGGSLIFSASLGHLLGKGRVIGVDIEIRPHNREAIEAHPLFPFITLVEGSSIDPSIVDRVKSSIEPGETVMVFLDSCHTKEHVFAELEAYAPLVTAGSYIVAMDGIMGEVVGAPRTEPDWTWNNPRQAAMEFVENRDDFVIEEPAPVFNEGSVTRHVTYFPGGYIKRIK